jgi:membrane protease YdiL (CAAX protease family)
MTTTTPRPATEGAVRAWVRRRPLLAFSLPAFGLGWPIMFWPALAERHLLPGPAPPLPVVILAITYGVLVPAALGVTAVTDGRKGVRRLLARAGQWRVGVRAWPLAVLAVPAGTVLIGVAAGGTILFDPADLGGLVRALATVVTALVLIHLAEELVWAGFVQLRIGQRTGTLRAAALTAVPFAAIHLPLTLLGRQSLRSVVTDIAGLLLLAVVVRALVGALLAGTAGSVLAAAAAHAGFNAANNLGGPADRLLVGVDQGLFAPAAALVTTAVLLRVLTRRGLGVPPPHHRDDLEPERQTPVMPRALLLPVLILVVALIGVAVAALLDTGGPASRDAALLVGTTALWAAAAAALWSLSALGYLAYRRHRANRF